MHLQGGLKNNVLWPIILFPGVEEGSVKLFKKFKEMLLLQLKMWTKRNESLKLELYDN